jgi:hypothetical protein
MYTKNIRITYHLGDMNNVFFGTFHQTILHAGHHLKEEAKNSMLTSLSIDNRLMSKIGTEV